MKLTRLLALVGTILLSCSAWAQTDVTSTYLTNANFETDDALTSTYLYGYGKDGSPYGFQAITGWTSVVTAGDNSNANYPNSGMAGGVFSYGSSTQLKGNAKAAPATNPNGEATGKCFGFFGVWGCGGYYYQNVTLAAGKYTITVPMYNQSGTQANTTYTGFFPTSGTNKTVAVNPTVGQWVNQTVTFTLADNTEGQIRIGYQSTGSGSGANSMLFIDCVKIEFTAIVVKDVLETALTAATAANTVLSDATLATAITTARGVFDDEDATQEEVNAAAATLNTATELAMSAVGNVTGVFLTNPGFESCAAEGSDVAAKTIKDYSSAGWTKVNSGDFTTIAATAYGGGVKVGGSNTPSTKKDGTTVEGNTLGIIAGWGDNVTIQSNYVTLPAGVYTFTVDHYLTSSTSNYGNTSSKFGFVTASESYLVSNTAFSASTWTTETVTFTLTESTTGKIQIGLTGLNNSGSGSPAVFYDDITITYRSFLAGAKAAYDKAVEDAETAKTECANVTGEELTALNDLLNAAEPTTVDGYNVAAEAIEDATATLTAAKGAYDAYAEIRAVAVALSVEPGDAPASAAAAPAATHTLNVAVYNATTAENFFDVTEIYNPSWSSMSTSSGQHFSGDGSISYADEWRGDTNPTTRNTTVTLPAGSYVLMSAGRGSANTVTTMSANGTIVTFASNGDMGIGINKLGAASFDPDDTAGFANKSGEAVNTGTGWEWRYIPVTLAEETDVTVTQTLTRLSGGAWGSFSDFRIMKIGTVATSDDYDDLDDAIDAAEAKALGFEDGEYAPYNNVEALTALAQAKAIDQDVTNDQDIVQAVTTALTSATWTANEGDVDIIYNGDFAIANGYNPKGWTRSNSAWGQQITGLTQATNDVNDGTTTAWYYNTEGAWEYGKDDVYKMPLAASTAYKLTFKYRSHASGSNNYMKASVLNDSDEGLAEVTFDKNGDATKFVTATAYFTTGAAGNYVLSLTQSGNTHLTDVSLVKVASTTLEISEEATSAPENRAFYETVNLTRTLSADYWNTFSVPFDAAIPDGWEVKEFDSFDENVISFTDAASFEAGVPYLVKPATDVVNPTFDGVTVKVTEGKTVVNGGLTFAAQIYNKSLATDGTIAYLATDESVKKLTSGGIKGLRAYFVLPSGTEAKALVINLGDEETGINSIDNGQLTIDNAKIYNLAGQRVSKAQKGLYIVNGKKVIIK